MVDSCGRVRRVQVLVDELCGPSTDLDLLRVPMFRDGTVIDGRLFAVDASHLWTISISDPTVPMRSGMTSGLGTPLATAKHEDRLLLAAGREGLITMTSSSALLVDRRLRLPGPAIDVAVQDARAFVAAGESGLIAVSLDDKPHVESVLPLEGFAVAVALTASTAYVATCGGVSIVDLASMSVVGRVVLDRPVAMKDVAVAGDRLFVAAGVLGALEVDVSDRAQPQVLGACVVNEPTFYASGVKATPDRLLVAGGEWGILDVARNEERCAPLPPLSPEPEQEMCTIDPPWVTVVVPPPDPPVDIPRGRDPVQVLYDGELVFGFGDARRIGVRAVDVHDASRTIHDDSKIGRYEQPSVVARIAAANGRLLAIGEDTGLFEATPEGWRRVQPFDGALIDVAFLEDGRYVLLYPGQMVVEGEAAQPFDIVASGRMAIDGDRVAVPSLEGVLLIDVSDLRTELFTSPEPAAFAPVVAVTPTSVILASAEWDSAFDVTRWSDLPPHRAFEAAEVADYERWVYGPPRRLLLATSHGVLEAASFGGRSLAVLHGETPRSIPIGPTALTAAASSGDRIYLTAGDFGTYRSELITLSIAGGELVLLSSRSFTGVAVDVAVDGDRIYIADTDSGIRVFEVEP